MLNFQDQMFHLTLSLTWVLAFHWADSSAPYIWDIVVVLFTSWSWPGIAEPESEVFGWNRSRIPNNTGSKNRIFCPTPEIQLNHFFHHTFKLGIPVELVQFLLKLLLKHISCCAPRFLLTAKFHSLYVKESEIWEKSDILPPTPQPLTLGLLFVHMNCEAQGGIFVTTGQD